MGPQELAELLAGHESVGSTPTASGIACGSLEQVEGIGICSASASWSFQQRVLTV
jgi:hypothetical protein